MHAKRLGLAALAGLTLAGAMIATLSPAEAWCRFGRCGGWGWRGPGVFLRVPGPYAYGAGAYAYGPRRGGYYVCPRGFHWAADGDGCISNR